MMDKHIRQLQIDEDFKKNQEKSRKSWADHNQEMTNLHIGLQKARDEIYNDRLNKRGLFKKLFNIKPDMRFVDMCQMQEYIHCVKDINAKYAKIHEDMRRIMKDDPIDIRIYYLKTHTDKQLIKSAYDKYMVEPINYKQDD